MSDIIPTEEVDDTPLGHGQLGAIKHYLKDLTRQNITDLGLVLGLWLPTIGDRPDFLNHVMSQWLNQVDNVASKGKPSWRSLVQGLRNEQVRQNGIANEIAEDHHTQEIKNARPQATAQTKRERPDLALVAAPDTSGRPVIDFNEPLTRKDEVAVLRAKHPQKVLVIVKRNHKERHLPQLKKPKFLVYEELTVGEFHADLRSRMGLLHSQTLFLLVNDKCPAMSTSMREIYEEEKDEDGVLYMVYASLAFFG